MIVSLSYHASDAWPVPNGSFLDEFGPTNSAAEWQEICQRSYLFEDKLLHPHWPYARLRLGRFSERVLILKHHSL
jgi:hypothetical protein